MNDTAPLRMIIDSEIIMIIVYTDIFEDIALRLATLPPPRSLPTYPMHIQNPLSIPQLTTLLTLLNQSLDIIDISTWTGDARDSSFIGGQLRLLADSIDEARLTLKGGEELPGGKWWDPREDDDVCSSVDWAV